MWNAELRAENFEWAPSWKLAIVGTLSQTRKESGTSAIGLYTNKAGVGSIGSNDHILPERADNLYLLTFEFRSVDKIFP